MHDTDLPWFLTGISALKVRINCKICTQTFMQHTQKKRCIEVHAHRYKLIQSSIKDMKIVCIDFFQFILK